MVGLEGIGLAVGYRAQIPWVLDNDFACFVHNLADLQSLILGQYFMTMERVKEIFG